MMRSRYIAVSAALFVLGSAVSVRADSYKISLSPTVVGPSQVKVEITSTIPGTLQVMLGLSLTHQQPNDVYIGTTKRITIKNGRAVATIAKDGLPKGRYLVEASFYPRWGPQDATAKAAGLKSEIHARRVVSLKGTGESARKLQGRENSRKWVMQHVAIGTRWNRSFWISRFGRPEHVRVNRWNPRVIKAYYFKSIGMTIFVNTLKNTIQFWRLGKMSQ